MKKLLSILLIVIVAAGVVGCGAKKEDVADKKIIKVGASPAPHKEILDFVKPLLAKKGYTLEIKEFSDYIQPNLAVDNGELDANFFQHVPYLNQFNKEHNTHLTYTVKVHLEPMGVYSKKVKKLADLENGAIIAIPNDASNGARALRVLEKAGLLKLKSGELVSKLDITDNPKKLVIKELDAAQLPRVLQDVDAAVINTNYALLAKLNPNTDALAIEAKDSPYANVLAVAEKDKNKPYIKALSEVLNSSEVKKFIQDKYKGSIIPAF